MPRKSVDTVPSHPELYRAEVLRSVRLSPNLHRVTITGDALADFPWRGFDHWFRLFLRLPHQSDFQLPNLSGTGWWKQYRLIPKARRPHCSNYTVAEFRAEQREMDIDFVVHRGPDGQLEGAAAIWAVSARPGEPLALLDQGILFDKPADATEVLIVADESGLPAVGGILRSLPRDTVGRVVQEVPTALDRRDFDGPPGVEVSWIFRDGSGLNGSTVNATAVNGTAVNSTALNSTALVGGAMALLALQALPPVHPDGYAFVVGESSLATSGRRHLHRLGLPKDRITFSGFWKH